VNIDSDDDEETEAAKRRDHGKAITDGWTSMDAVTTTATAGQHAGARSARTY
jgi:hypothetical protein